MTADDAPVDPQLVEDAVRAALGPAYDDPDPRVRYAAATPAAQLHAAIAESLAAIRAYAVDELSPEGVDKAALARELGIKRQRVGQLKEAAARARRAAAERAAQNSK